MMLLGIKPKRKKNLKDTDDEVTILSLIPIKKTKKGFTPLDKEKARNAGWAKLTLNL